MRAAHDELQRAVPYIKSAYANGDECTYRNTRVPLLVSSALEYLNAADGGPSAKLKLLYFQDAPTLAQHVDRLRKNLTAEKAQFFCGAVRISQMQHHAAVVGLVKNDRAALLVLDSLISKNVQNGSSPVKQFKYRAGRLRRFLSHRLPFVGSGFEHETFNALRDTEKVNVCYAYTGAQASSRDCASFTVDMLRTLQENVEEQLSHFNLLDFVLTSPEHPGSPPTLPGLRRTYIVKAPGSHVTNRHFVLNGEAFLPPRYYRHAQSKSQLQRYCKQSPLVDARAAQELNDFHDAGRRTMRTVPVAQPSRKTCPKTVTANFSIRQAQIELLEQTARHFEQRLAIAADATAA